MDDLISRQVAIDTLTTECSWIIYDEDGQLTPDGEEILGTLKEIPSARKKGHWNFVGDNLFECTCCGKMYTTQQLNGLRVYDKDPYCPFFCPHCGADMRGEEDG